MRCQALTLKGQQCKNQASNDIIIPSDDRKPVSTGQVCAVHLKVYNNGGKGATLKFIALSGRDDNGPSYNSTSPSKLPSLTGVKTTLETTKPPSNTESYIYIYTFLNSIQSANAHVYDHKTGQFLSLPKGKQLIKVGYTSRDVNKRLSEWEFKCGHKLVLLNSYTVNEKDNVVQGGTRRHGLIVEGLIHNSLRNTYGSGHVVCDGCDSSVSNKVSPNATKVQSSYDIHNPRRKHVEWFLIDSDQIKNVYKLINKIIEDNNGLGKAASRVVGTPKKKKRWLCF